MIVKSQSIRSSVTALGLLKKKKERWTKCVGGNIQNTNFQGDSNEVKVCNQCGCPCTARLDSLNRVILQHNEGIQWTTYQCRWDASLELAWHDSRFWHAYRPLCTRIPLVHSSRYVSHCETYGVDNPGEVRSTAVYPPSLICLNSVRNSAIVQCMITLWSHVQYCHNSS